MAEQKKSGPYTEDDMVHVVNDAGEVQKDPVPAAWVGTDLLPAGSKKATKAQVEKADGGDSSDGDSGSGDSSDSPGS